MVALLHAYVSLAACLVAAHFSQQCVSDLVAPLLEALLACLLLLGHPQPVLLLAAVEMRLLEALLFLLLP